MKIFAITMVFCLVIAATSVASLPTKDQTACLICLFVARVSKPKTAESANIADNYADAAADKADADLFPYCTSPQCEPQCEKPCSCVRHC